MSRHRALHKRTRLPPSLFGFACPRCRSFALASVIGVTS